ncbi:gas vesicle protein GvpJ [Natronorarus salvus]|uniref:gas vesicle protein GvpJ n=1 Tax=Natronorarus salvus TaxID=3117733 RepID=UPI002F262CE2
MADGPGPVRDKSDLADVLEMILDKGIVINADIAVTVGQTELLGIELRAAIASFETAAEYGLAFPSGTDMRRVEQASGREPLEEGEVDLGIGAARRGPTTHPTKRPNPKPPAVGVKATAYGESEDEEGSDSAEETSPEESDGDDDS